MATLTVGGVAVPISASAGSANLQIQEIGGERARMFDGTARQTVVARKRVWTIVTRLMTAAERDTLIAALDATPPIACTGDLMEGASVNCTAQRTAEATQWTAGQPRYALTFILYES